LSLIVLITLVALYWSIQSWVGLCGAWFCVWSNLWSDPTWKHYCFKWDILWGL